MGTGTEKFKDFSKNFAMWGPREWVGYAGDVYNIDLGAEYDTAKYLRIRHFRNPLSSDHVLAFSQICRAIEKWVANANLSHLVFIEQPAKMGSDFIALPNAGHAFFQSTFDIDDEHHPLMQGYKAALPAIEKAWQSLDETDNIGILKHIIKRSLLELSLTTYFDDNTSKVVVFEPVISVKDIMAWQLSSKIDN